MTLTINEMLAKKSEEEKKRRQENYAKAVTERLTVDLPKVERLVKELENLPFDRLNRRDEIINTLEDYTKKFRRVGLVNKIKGILPKNQLKACLKCDKEFYSQALNNRICTSCKNSENYTSHCEEYGLVR